MIKKKQPASWLVGEMRCWATSNDTTVHQPEHVEESLGDS